MPVMRDTFYQIRDCLPLWRAALALSLIAILWLATTSYPSPALSAPSDKVNHFIAFMELTLLSRLGWPGKPVLRYAYALLAFGLTLELIQSQLDYRDFSWADLLADGAGIALGLLPWPLLPPLGKMTTNHT
ncbi:MAG: VanZ family protein [Marinobacter sp.]|nr:VanZ family protein [Marinobacter sp.]